MKILIVDQELSDIRLDKYLTSVLETSRSKIQKLIEDNNIEVNEKIVKNSHIVRVDDEIKVLDYEEESTDVIPENIPLDIKYEDEYLLVVNKPSGMVVHPSIGHYKNTLVNALMYHTNLSNNGIRPGIVHRIDKDTSGLLLVAKNDEVHAILSDEISKKNVKRKYIALVDGVINNETGTIDAPIGRDMFDRKKMSVTDSNSKEAVTHFKVLERYKTATLIECILETGRTHQIRVHMNYIGYPIVNDPVYGRRKRFDESGQCLHAAELGFIHPKTGEYMEFSCPLPECFTNILSIVKDN